MRDGKNKGCNWGQIHSGAKLLGIVALVSSCSLFL